MNYLSYLFYVLTSMHFPTATFSGLPFSIYFFFISFNTCLLSVRLKIAPSWLKTPPSRMAVASKNYWKMKIINDFLKELVSLRSRSLTWKWVVVHKMIKLYTFLLSCSKYWLSIFSMEAVSLVSARLQPMMVNTLVIVVLSGCSSSKKDAKMDVSWSSE